MLIVGRVFNTQICFSKIKVTRLSYENAEINIGDLKLGQIPNFAKNFTQRRLENGAVELDFPEVKIALDADKKVKIPSIDNIMLDFDIGASGTDQRYTSQAAIERKKKKISDLKGMTLEQIRTEYYK
mgnify:CR=1 FL=1